MPRNSIAEYSEVPDENEDIAGIVLKENSTRVRDVNNAIRTLMSHLRTRVDEIATYDERTDDVSSELLVGPVISITGVDPVTNELTVPANHDLCSGMPIYATGSSAVFTAGQIYWVIRDPDVPDKIKLAATYEFSIAGIAIPASGGLFDIQVHKDPTQTIYKIADGNALDGSQGASVLKLEPASFTPYLFGARAELMDNSKSLQMFLHYLRNSYDAVSKKYTVSALCGGIPYRHTLPLQFGKVNQPGARIHDLSLVSACTGEIALDLSGLNTGFIDGLDILGEELNPPSVGTFISRIAQMLEDGVTPKTPWPAASDSNLTNHYIQGDFGVACSININADIISYEGSKYTNSLIEEGTLIIAADADAVQRRTGTVVRSRFWPTPDETVPASDIGTITDVNLNYVGVRHRLPWQLGVESADYAGGSVDLTVEVGGLAAQGLIEGSKIYFTNANNTFTLEEGNYTIGPIIGDTFTLWNEDNTAQILPTTGGIDGSAIQGTLTTGKIRPRQNASMTICGPADRVIYHGYVLGFGETGIVLDLKNGPIRDSSFNVRVESARQNTFKIIPHETEDRDLSNTMIAISGDLAGKAHIKKEAGGKVYFDGGITVGANQAGTQSLIFNSNARLFGGDVAGLFVNLFKGSSITRSGFLDNVAEMGWFHGEVYDVDERVSKMWPQGQYNITFTNPVNLDGLPTANNAQFWTVGDVTTVMVQGNFNATAAGLATVNLSLPVASDLLSTSLHGVGLRINNNNEQATIRSAADAGTDPSNDTATLSFLATGTAAYNYELIFNYRIRRP